MTSISSPPPDSPIAAPLRGLRGVSGRQLGPRMAEMIRSGRLGPGEVFPSERQLSSELNVSRGTVRKVLAKLESEGLLSSGGQGRLRQVAGPPMSESIMASTVLVIGFDRMPHERLRSEPGWEPYAQFTASAKLQGLGWHCLIINPDEATPAQISLLRKDPPAGVVVARPRQTVAVRDLIERLGALGLKIVSYGGETDAPQDRLYHDHAAGAATLTKWLLAQGCRRVLPFWRFPARYDWIRQREAGYRAAMAEAGLEALDSIATPDLRLDGDAEPFDDMVRLQMGFLHQPMLGDTPIDALMCANDLHAAEAMEAIRRLGKTPGKDVLVVGYDNTWQRDARNPDRVEAPAATIDKHNDKVGEALADLLHERLQGRLPQEPQQRAAAFSLVTPSVSAAPSL